MFAVLGASPTAGAWFNVFAVLGKYFYHSNLRTPRWVGYILQRPEHHSIHHQLDVHASPQMLRVGIASPLDILGEGAIASP